MKLLALCSTIGLLLYCKTAFGDVCPGGQVRCPEFMTCCELSEGSFGCCPFPDAKCCVDRIHCCPHNMECDTSHQSCIRNGSSLQLHWQVPLHSEVIESVLLKSVPVKQEEAKLPLHKGSANECPDKTTCNSKFTCCKMYSGKYGCCPFDNGTCCLDGFHCCPATYQCSSSGECYSPEMNGTLNGYPLKDEKIVKLTKSEISSKEHQKEHLSDPGGLCPDGHPCPVKYTCCKIKGKRYGCCPYTDARCCDDGIHCCPKGTNCNITLGTCDIQRNNGLSIPTHSLLNLELPHPSEDADKPKDVDIVMDNICPDERYQCPTGMTCCKISGGGYGCCPLDRATCCRDNKHCCPYGYNCVGDGCQKGHLKLPSYVHAPAVREITLKTKIEEEKTLEVFGLDNVTNVVCPDQYPCPDGNTCCPLESGDYGCCPMEKATCCDDKIHCCPNGYRCLDGGCKKESSDVSFTLLGKTLDKQLDQEVNVVCPDKSKCPEGATCCELATGGFGCCPYKDATCCGDGEHCCPHGFWCSDDSCDRVGSNSLHPLTSLLKKIYPTKM